MDCFGTCFTHVQTCNVTRVQSATQWTASVHTLHMYTGLQGHLTVRLKGGTLMEGFQVPSGGTSGGYLKGGFQVLQRGLKGGYLKEGLQGTFRGGLRGGALRSP